jgi:heme exporter protein B
MRFWDQVFAIVRKDILSEIRTKESIVSVLVFTLLVIIVFNFAFDSSTQTMELVGPGILWVTFAFAGVISMNRSFLIEREEGCIEGLLACPVPREAIYLGKMFGTFIFMLVIEIVALPIFAFLFNLSVLSFQIIIVTLLTTIGFVSVGTLFSAMAVNTKAREMVLPILFLPIISPVIIAAVKAAGLALSGESWSSMATWLEIIAAFDVVFVVASYLLFAYIIEE